jgi:hypothetical protein
LCFACAAQAQARGCSLEKTARLAARFSVQPRSVAALPSLVARAGKAARRSALVRLSFFAHVVRPSCARVPQQPCARAD